MSGTASKTTSDFGGYQWLRKVKLAIVPPDGKALDLSELHIVFEVRHVEYQTPNNASIRIYNVSDKTAEMADKIMKQKGWVVLEAGYENGPFGQIFIGGIVQIRHGKENAHDTFLDILAVDGDAFYNFSQVNTTLQAGYTHEEELAVIQKALNEKQMAVGQINIPRGNPSCRGRVMFGPTKDYLRGMAQETDTSWSIQDGQLCMLPPEAANQLPVIILTSKTGLLGLPQQTVDGIEVQCLLNPNMRPGRRVKIDNKSIQLAQQAVGINEETIRYNLFLSKISISQDGTYKVVYSDFTGDTRGNDFYCNMICLDANSGWAPPGLLPRVKIPGASSQPLPGGEY